MVYFVALCSNRSRVLRTVILLMYMARFHSAILATDSVATQILVMSLVGIVSLSGMTKTNYSTAKHSSERDRSHRWMCGTHSVCRLEGHSAYLRRSEKPDVFLQFHALLLIYREYFLHFKGPWKVVTVASKYVDSGGKGPNPWRQRWR